MGIHGYCFGMDSITSSTILTQFMLPKIRPFVSDSAMMTGLFPRTLFMASDSSFRDGRLFFGSFVGAVAGACPEAGAGPDAVADGLPVEAAEGDAMMKPDAGEAEMKPDAGRR